MSDQEECLKPIHLVIKLQNYGSLAYKKSGLKTAFFIIMMLDEGKIIFSGSKNEILNTDNPYVKNFIEGKIENL